MKTFNRGSIYKNEQWGNIFKFLVFKNPHKSFWIEKVYYYKDTDSLFADKSFSHYQLACEEGYKNRIPSKFNEYIARYFKDERYITELK